MKVPLPHVGVLARLGVSSIHGIGVFAGKNIAEGTLVFENDQRPLRWVDKAAVDESVPSPFEQALYDDFAIRRDGQLGTPESFDVLSVGWYVNEPAAGTLPNLRAGPETTFFAARDIQCGEEQTITYADFSHGR